MVFHPKSVEEAKKIYYRQEAIIFQYTQLVVNRRKYNGAEAKRFFGVKEEMTPLVLPKARKKGTIS